MEVVADVSNSQEALEVYDVLITDIKMPVMRGMELMDRKQHISDRKLSATNDSVIRSSLFYQYLFGNTGEEDVNPLDTLYPDLKSRRIMVAALRVETKRQAGDIATVKTTVMHKSILTAIEGILREYDCKFVICTHRNQVVLLFAFQAGVSDAECRAECEMVARHVENHMKSYFNMDASYGFSAIGCAEQFRELFRQAKKALEEGFIYGKGHCHAIPGMGVDTAIGVIRRNLDEITALCQSLFGRETAKAFSRATAVDFNLRDTFIIDLKEQFIQWLQLPGALMRCSGNVFDTLQQRYANDIIEADSLADCTALFMSFLRELSAVEKSMPVLSPEIAKAIGYIEKNLSDVGLMNTARHVNLSQSYFSTVFKKELGVSFSDYVIQSRIDKAKELFIANDYKICHVAMILGFNDPSYFSRVFKKITGIRPNEYRSKFLVN